MQALIATLFTWALTALGAGAVFLFKKPAGALLDAALGAAAGVMTAASFFSLLAPASELARELGMNETAALLTGFLGGGVLLFLGDRIWAGLDAQGGRRRAAGGAARRSARGSRSDLLLETLKRVPDDRDVDDDQGDHSFGADIDDVIDEGIGDGVHVVIGGV